MLCFAELHSLIADLGKKGGLLSPSVYDTAQVLRLYPPSEGVELGLTWLRSQQQIDGGWGDPAIPLSRHAPTLAAVLAFQTYQSQFVGAENCIDIGMRFLREHAPEWSVAHVDEFPVGVELTFPKLIEEAIDVGLEVPSLPYQDLFAIGNAKRRKNRTHRASRWYYYSSLLGCMGL